MKGGFVQNLLRENFKKKNEKKRSGDEK